MTAAMPGDIGTEPESRLVFNAPYDQNQSISIRIPNSGGPSGLVAGNHWVPPLPGEIGTEPESPLVFNAPYDQNQSISFRVANKGDKKIGRAIKCYKHAFVVEPPCGTLEPKERVQLSVTCHPYNIVSEGGGGAKDRITMEWTDAPAGAGNKFERSWFAGSGIIRRKVVSCDYNA